MRGSFDFGRRVWNRTRLLCHWFTTGSARAAHRLSLRTLVLPPHSQERRYAEPGKQYSEANRISQTAGANLSCVVLPIFLPGSAAETERHDQEDHAGHFQPKLMHDMAEGSGGSANPAPDGVKRATSSRLLSGDAGDHSHFSPSGNFAHGLDFSSLERYNDATLKRRTVMPQRASNVVLLVFSGRLSGSTTQATDERAWRRDQRISFRL